MTQHKIHWHSHHRKAQCAPNPAYPDGMVIETDVRPACMVELPYPAPECGLWLVKCNVCGYGVMITAAGRPDDPKAIRIPCDVAAGGVRN